MTEPQSTLESALGGAETVIDVRTPAEHAKGAIAGSVNIPLFSDGERAELGTLYKQVGRGTAVGRGQEIVGKRLKEFVSAFEPHRERRLLVYCARGGMRSASVVKLLELLDYRVAQLPGGYKAFRKYLLAELERLVPQRIAVIHGQTGVGKTRILRQLPNMLDLEDLAQHRSSLFGGVNRRPRTQQQFEAHLLQALQALDPSRPVWVEGESRKVGPVMLPKPLMVAMKQGTCVLLTASLETRVRRIVEEYSGDDPGTLPQLVAALRTLAPLFGKARTEELVDKLQAGDSETVVRSLLVDYYDSRYRHAMRQYRYALTLSAEDEAQAVAALRAFSPPAAREDPLPRAGTA